MKISLLFMGSFHFVLGVCPEPKGTTPEPETCMANRSMSNSINVRTVIFRQTDTCRVCWSKNDLNLLIARRLVQDLLPRKIPKDFESLLTYFTYILEEVRAKFPQKNFQIMLMAMYDALGGYLYSIVMPVLNEAFYAGNVDFKTVSALHNMLGYMMDYLGTNGNGWAPPCDMSRIPTKVAPLPLKMPKVENPCDAFVIPALAQEKPCKEDKDFYPQDRTLLESKIQIPFLDDNGYPSAVAVPLKEHPLFSLMSECSVNIIPKYYIMAMRCLSCPPFTNRDVIAFNKNLHRWIIINVVPHLHETTRWYPGFGSIMRVVETMNQRGLASTETATGRVEVEPGPNDVLRDSSFSSVNSYCGGDDVPCWAWLVLVLLLFLLFLLICTLIHCVFIVLRRRRRCEDRDCDFERGNNPFINLYCGLKKKGKRDVGSAQSKDNVQPKCDPYRTTDSSRSKDSTPSTPNRSISRPDSADTSSAGSSYGSKIFSKSDKKYPKFIFRENQDSFSIKDNSRSPQGNERETRRLIN